MHTPQPAATITGAPFTASTEYSNQYLPKSLTFNQIGTHGSTASANSSRTQQHRLPTVSSETTNQHDFPNWGVAPPQKKGYAMRVMAPAPALDFAGDTFTTTNAVEYQAKPLSYVRPTGMVLLLLCYPWLLTQNSCMWYAAVIDSEALELAGDLVTTTHAVEHQAKPLSYVRPTVMALVSCSMHHSGP